MLTQVIVIFGGKSAEHEVSLKSAMTVINAMDRTYFQVVGIYITREGAWHNLGVIREPIANVEQLMGQPANGNVSSSIGNVLAEIFGTAEKNVVFPVMHGPNGEDGTLQGLLEMLNVPYVGNGVLASAAGMDKEMTKRVMKEAGIPQAPYVTFTSYEWERQSALCCEATERQVGYPCYVKPANMGSSIGIRRCGNRAEWEEAVEQAFRYDHKVVIEQEIPGREVQVAVLGNEEPIVSIAGEFVREPTFFHYAQKYLQGNLVQQIPAKVSNAVYDQIHKYAVRAFQALCGSGLMRVDFFVTDRDEVYFNEVNTLPGFTQNSMYPVLWNRTSGLTYPQLVQRLIRLALERHAQKQLLHYELEAELTEQGRRRA